MKDTQCRVAGAGNVSLFRCRVFLCMAELLRELVDPGAVMLWYRLGVIGAILAKLTSGSRHDVFFQVGLLTTVGRRRRMHYDRGIR